MDRSVAIKIAQQLGFTDPLLRVCSGERLPPPLDIYLGSPDEFYRMTNAELVAAFGIPGLWLP
jgi:hypothetical protein